MAFWIDATGWSLTKLAAATGIERQKIWRMTSGKQSISAADIKRFSATLGISSKEFWGDIPCVQCDTLKNGEA